MTMEKEYNLIFDRKFEKDFRKLDNSLQIEDEKKIKKLKQNPRDIGKPLKYIPNLFELHLRMYRIFYTVDDKNIRVLLLSIEHKEETDKYIRSLNIDKIKQIINEEL